MQAVVKAFCKNPEHKRPPVLARYAWSELEAVWERVDQHGSDRDMWFSTSADGALEMYPRPEFPCPCGRAEVYDHDTIQGMIAEATASGERLWV